ncbi:TPM domain-containing protein [Bartonella bacilliformis]|uniref:TPM domain-containing protein n=1 Tax=Bartonella bacilliformis TaxID=774 RepID=UPI0039E5D2A6
MVCFPMFIQRATFFPYLWVLISLLYLAIASNNIAYSQTQFPILTGYVNDGAHLLDHTTIEDLTEKLDVLEKKTGNQVVIATVPTLSGIDIETYSNSLFRTWSLGQKQINNGVLLIVAPNEREVRIEVGYGLEGELTDVISAVIINNFILPSFRKENYQEGIVKAINAIINITVEKNSDFTNKIKEQAKVLATKHKQTKKEKIIINIVIFLIFFIMVCLPILAMIFGEKVASGKYRWMGIIFTFWFTNINAGGRYTNRGLSRHSFNRRFKGGGGSSGGGGASGKW